MRKASARPNRWRDGEAPQSKTASIHLARPLDSGSCRHCMDASDGNDHRRHLCSRCDLLSFPAAAKRQCRLRTRLGLHTSPRQRTHLHQEDWPVSLDVRHRNRITGPRRSRIRMAASAHWPPRAASTAMRGAVPHAAGIRNPSQRRWGPFLRPAQSSSCHLRRSVWS